MSIVITGEDIPTGCIDCPCRHHDGESMEEICQALNKIIDLDFHSICIKRMLDCPLKELKDVRPDNT